MRGGVFNATKLRASSRLRAIIYIRLMITLYAFNQLSENEKAEATWGGTYLSNRTEDGRLIQLYSLPDFYVEVYYHPEANTITRFRAFKSLGQLVPYIRL